MAKQQPKKSINKVSPKQKSKVYNCDDVEAYLDKAVNKIKGEILPRIEILDERDKSQYDAAKKIIVDAHAILLARQNNVESTVVNVKQELDDIIKQQHGIVKGLTDSLEGLHNKLDQHVHDEDSTFTEIKNKLNDIYNNGTIHTKELINQLNNVKVNGGVYPFNEAMQYIYKQHLDTHAKLDEVITLVEPIQARRRWARATRELIKKNGFLHFILSTKIGAVIGTILLLLIINTLMVDVFKVNLDLSSILKWLGSFAK